ncbi:hypothetical protein [Tahibacter caeni]|uniref:hypothetical protein n=1 Tax=Tahibacter caeni TaxID=1453545 RepID=UPI0021473884|nr:hypothetical protein [Tahibacter caeni]
MRRTINQLSQDFDAAIDWLERQRVAPGHRFERYREILDVALATPPGTDIPIETIEYYGAICEIDQLCDIAALPDAVVDSAQARRKLRTMVDGEPFYFANQGPQDPGRDAGFELSTAARFATAGFAVRLEHPADVSVRDLAGTELQIECKRPRGPRNLEPNLVSAYRQLVRTKAVLPESIPIVAIDLTLIVNAEFRPIVYPSEKVAGDRFDAALYRFEVDHGEAFANADYHGDGEGRIAARLYSFSGMFHIGDDPPAVGTLVRLGMTEAQQRTETGARVAGLFRRLHGFDQP